MIRGKKRKGSARSGFIKRVKDRAHRRRRKIRKVLLFLFFGFLAYRFFAGPYGFVQIHSLWKEKRGLERESKLLQAEIIDLEIEKKRLTSDRFYLEKQARERLGMIKEGEKVYRIIYTKKHPPEKGNTSFQSPPPDSLSP